MLLGPALIHYKPTNGTNITQHLSHMSVDLSFSNSSNSTQTPEEVRKEIDTYMEILAALSVVLFGLFLVYFPSKPPHPPAPTSAIERTEFLAGIKALLTNKDTLLACFAYSVPGVRQ
jgi:hypothetical protein